MKIILKADGSIHDIDRGINVFSGSNLAKDIVLTWNAPFDEGIEISAVQCQITRLDAQTNGYIPMVAHGFEDGVPIYRYRLTDWDTALNGEAAVHIKYKSTNDIETVDICTSELNLFIHKGAVNYMPEPSDINQQVIDTINADILDLDNNKADKSDLGDVIALNTSNKANTVMAINEVNAHERSTYSLAQTAKSTADLAEEYAQNAEETANELAVQVNDTLLNLGNYADTIANKLDKKPNGANNLIDENDKINTLYIPDVILGQLVHAGSFNESGIISARSNFMELEGVEINSIDVNQYEGCYFIASGNHSFYELSFAVGDWAVCHGNATKQWVKIVNTDAVSSVNNKTGAIVLSAADVDAVAKSVEVTAERQIYVKNADGSNTLLDENILIPEEENPNKLIIVADITERDALPEEELSEGLKVHCEDASDDPSIKSGWAEYLRTESGTWKKTAEEKVIDNRVPSSGNLSYLRSQPANWFNTNTDINLGDNVLNIGEFSSLTNNNGYDSLLCLSFYILKDGVATSLQNTIMSNGLGMGYDESITYYDTNDDRHTFYLRLIHPPTAPGQLDDVDKLKISLIGYYLNNQKQEVLNNVTLKLHRVTAFIPLQTESLEEEIEFNGDVTGAINIDGGGFITGALDGDYNLTISGQVTGYAGSITSFTGTLSGDMSGDITGSIETSGVNTMAAIINGTGTTKMVRIIGAFPQTGTPGYFEGAIITGEEPTYVDSLEITSLADELKVDETLQLSVVVSPISASNEVYWSVYADDSDKASITENGLLTGIDTGTVTVIAKASDGSLKSATKTITVTQNESMMIDYVSSQMASTLNSSENVITAVIENPSDVPDDLAGYCVDAKIVSGVALPSGSSVSAISWNGTPLPVSGIDLSGLTEIYLSQLLGAGVSTRPDITTSTGIIDNWVITLDISESYSANLTSNTVISNNDFTTETVLISASCNLNITIVPTYTLSYNLNGGTSDAIPPIELEEGELLIQPTTPTRDGYTFDGWYYGAMWEIPVEFDTTTMPTENLEIVAMWSEDVPAGEPSFNNTSVDVTFGQDTWTWVEDSSTLPPEYEGRLKSFNGDDAMNRTGNSLWIANDDFVDDPCVGTIAKGTIGFMSLNPPGCNNSIDGGDVPPEQVIDYASQQASIDFNITQFGTGDEAFNGVWTISGFTYELI